jgi:uncharacterized protein YbjT (DUF2867 family)
MDLLTGDGLDVGVDGMDAVVDASSARSRLARIRRVLVEGTGRLLRAEADMGIRHHLLISIVGIDAVPFSYCRIKLSQEAAVSGGRVPWRIVRCTQFQPLVDEIFPLFSRVGLLPRSAIPLQSIDPSDVAVAVVDRLEVGPSLGRTEVAGPETASVRELARTWAEVTRRRRLLAPLPLRGRAAAAVRSGALVARDAPRGSRTFAEWLRDRGGAVR